MPDTAPEFTIASEHRDFVEWRRERTHYAVWAIAADTPALQAASTAVRERLSGHLLAGYRRQPHVTLHLCGFPAAVGRRADDFPAAALHAQIAALQDAAPPPFELEIGGPASFASAVYLAVGDPAGALQASRRALARPGDTGDGHPYTPHVTCGLYRDAYHLPTLLRALADCHPETPVRLPVARLTLMAYEAAVIGGPLLSLCEFDLVTRRATVPDPALMARLFGVA